MDVTYNMAAESGWHCSVLRIRDPVIFDTWIRDPGSNKSGSGSGRHIQDSQHCLLQGWQWICTNYMHLRAIILHTAYYIHMIKKTLMLILNQVFYVMNWILTNFFQERKARRGEVLLSDLSWWTGRGEISPIMRGSDQMKTEKVGLRWQSTMYQNLLIKNTWADSTVNLNLLLLLKEIWSGKHYLKLTCNTI
jgi:hypothetical protein